MKTSQGPVRNRERSLARFRGARIVPSDFIRALPKAELHLHLEGSVDPATLAELSRRHKAPLPFPNNRYGTPVNGLRELSEAEVNELYRYKDFTGFLMAFKAVTERLRTPEDYELITYKLLERLRSENVLHAEVYVSIGVVHWRGQEFGPLFEGMESGRIRGERDFGISLLWIFDAVRHFGAEAAQRVLEETIQLHRSNPSVVGFGIGGDERQAAPEIFRGIYAHARSNGLRLTAHAGETTGPESIWGAINLGAERLGHGLNAWHDRELTAVLAEKQIPLEICLSSNLCTGCCAALDHHPLKTFFDLGLMVTLNTDDPAMFSTTLNEEYEIAQREFGFTNEHLREIARNSFEASFLPAEKKLEFLNRVDAI
jgi:aminodeoxyfutalosine deaminase